MLSNALTVAVTLRAVDNMSRVIASAAGNASRQFHAVAASARAASAASAAFGAKSMAAGAFAGAALLAPVRAFMTLEDAQTQLRSTMMRSSGQISYQFAAIDALAMKLGNRLPGTTADFYAMASSLKSLGIAESDIAGGVLTAAANLGVVLKPLGVTFQDSAIAMAKFKEALGIAGSDMVAFADTIQRTAHLGVQLGEMRYAFSKVAPTLQTLRIQGLGAANDLAPLVAMMIKTGKSGEEVGSGLADVMKGALDTKKMGGANKELAKYGVQLDFVNQKTGQFKGVNNMIAQFDKLQKLTPVMRANLLSGLFGTGGAGDVAAIMVNQGVAGYQKMSGAMREQASLDKRVTLSLETLGNTWESLLGTVENTLSVFGGALAPELVRLANYFNGAAESVGKWAKANPALTKQIMMGVAGFAVLATAVGAGAVGLAVIGNGVAFVASGLGVLSTAAGIGALKLGAGFARAGEAVFALRMRFGMALGTLRTWGAAALGLVRSGALGASGLRLMGSMLIGSVVGGFKAAAVAVGAFAAALLTNPITWIVVGLGAAAALVYKYWKPLSGFFRGLWRGLVEGAKPVLAVIGPMFRSMAAVAMPALRQLASVVAVPFVAIAKLIAPLGGTLRALGGWIRGLLKPVDDVGGAGEKMGKRFGVAIAGMVILIATLPAKMAIGATNMMNALADGIAAGASKVLTRMQQVVTGIRAMLPFSPAKVGPLRDIHRIKLVETIAAGVKPAPLVQAMARVAGAARDAALPAMNRGLSPALAGAASRGGAGTVTVNYAPVLTIGSGGAEAKQEFGALLQKHKHEVDQLVRKAVASRDRTKFEQAR